MVAHAVAACEIHWSWPYGKPLSKYGWIFMARLFTYQDPSSRCVRSRKRRRVAARSRRQARRARAACRGPGRWHRRRWRGAASAPIRRRSLERQQLSHARLPHASVRVRPVQPEELHHAVLGGQRRLRRQPRRGASRHAPCIRAAGRRGIDGQRADAHRRPAEVAVLHRRACGPDPLPVAFRAVASPPGSGRRHRSRGLAASAERPSAGSVHQPVGRSARLPKLQQLRHESRSALSAPVPTRHRTTARPPTRACRVDRHRGERLRVAGDTPAVGHHPRACRCAGAAGCARPPDGRSRSAEERAARTAASAAGGIFELASTDGVVELPRPVDGALATG